jgi:hypothetical protein
MHHAETHFSVIAHRSNLGSVASEGSITTFRIGANGVLTAIQTTGTAPPTATGLVSF